MEENIKVQERVPGTDSRKVNLIRYGVLVLLALSFSVLISLLLIYRAGSIGEVVVRLVPLSEDASLLNRVPADQLSSYRADLEKEVRLLQKKLTALVPSLPYLVVNTTHNTFRLMKQNQVIREGMCSTGSYTILTRGEDKKWVFETPRGMMKVRSKQVNPVWVKPDWAFIEEGLPVPSPRHPSRYEYGTLGDYKLELKDGYLIHGTLYKRFLGMAVTHGCIRLGDEDLKEVYMTLKSGSSVFIY
ncbi:MAG: L,D-transpeptidase [Bacteroidales bacterium]|nr:L,D-transpeptidase [Bacteroidales bacterium]